VTIRSKLDTNGRRDAALDGYVFDRGSGLYKPEYRDAEDSRRKVEAGGTKECPLHANVRRDWVVILISILTLVGIAGTVWFTMRQWKEARRSVETAAKQLESSSRAWLKVGVTPFAGQGIIPSYLTFDNKGHGTLGLRTTIQNFGTVVATGGDLRIDAIAVGLGDQFEKPIEVQKEYCEGANKKTGSITVTVFPGDAYQEYESVGFDTYSIPNHFLT
jgi:hypothetical protein